MCLTGRSQGQRKSKQSRQGKITTYCRVDDNNNNGDNDDGVKSGIIRI